MAFRAHQGGSRASLRSPSHKYKRDLLFETCEARVVLNADPVVLLRDIETTTPGFSPSAFVEAGGKLYFAAGDALIGRELYVTDGIAAPKLVKDIWPGIEGSDPEDLISINGQLFFTADDGIHGRELWTSDGTAAGTRLVQDLEPGPESSVAFQFTAAGEFLFFTAETSAHGLELWLATTGGAQVIELNPGPDSSNPSDLVFYPQHLSDADPPILIPASVMLAATSPTVGHELWRVDVAGNTSLVKNIYHERLGDDPNSSNPGDLTLHNGLIYFRALDGEYNEENELESHGVELWVSDGTSAGTRLLADLAPQLIASPNGLIPASSSPSGFTRFNGKLYFAASDPNNGRELWRSDGTIDGTEFFRSLRSGSASSSPDNFTVVTDDLFFVADNGTGRELYRTDGTAVNTGLVRDIRAGTPSSSPQQLFAFGSQLLFTADDETNVGRELWISDGTFAGTQVVKNIAPDRIDSNPHDFALLNGLAYFSAFNFEHESEVWRTDGTEAGTQVFDVPTITTQGSEPTELVRWGTKLALIKDDGSLWVSDGSTAGTVPLAGLTANELLPVDDKLYFVRNQDELWVTNTQGQATLLKDFTTDESGFPQELTRFGNQVALVARTSAGGQQLWISDGTLEGTISLGPVDGGPRFLTVVGNTLYFTAIGPEDLELWKSDGTAEGTMIVKDIVLDGPSFPSNLFPVGDLLYFVASDAEHGDELWLTDGSEEGTRLVADVQAGPESSSPLPLGALGSTLLFFANDGASGQELWKTDGTLEGTTLVLDIQPGPESSPCDDELDGNTTVVFEGEVYFIADNGTHGCELWSSDGTAAGTFLVNDVAEGPLDAKPSWLTVVGDRLFFAANTYLLSSQTFAGRELFSTDGSTDGTALYSFINTVDNSGSEPAQLSEVSGRLYLVANDVIHGPEIWTTSLRLSLDDLVFEILAKDIAYRNWNLEDTISLEAYNLPHVFTVDFARQDASTGFDAFGLIAENIDPVLIVRGSVDFLTDWFSDFDPRGVGVSQFLPNIAGVRAWLDSIADTQAPVSITGHSLGGALTQLIAADYTSLGNRLGQIVTFNAPAISQDYADQFIPQYVDRVMHHITNGDPVSMAGDAFLPGAWRRYSFSDLNLANNHVLPVINERVFIDKPDPAPDVIRLRPDDLTFEDYATTEWLDSPFYFHTDLDYFIWLAVGQQLADAVLPQPAAFVVPKALLFRSTTELSRQLVGGFWHTLNDAVQQTIATVTCQSPDARVELPDIELNLVDILNIRATGLAISCVSDPDPVLRIQGEVTLPNVYNVTANFTGDNFIQLSDEGFDIVGVLSAENIPIVPGAFNVNSVLLGVNTLAGTLEAAGQLEIARWGVTIDAALGFVGGTQFNFVEVDISGINRPLGFILPGAFLQRIAGRLNHVAEADPLPTSFGGGIGMTLGPQIALNLPSWAGGTYDAKLLTIDVNGDFDRNHLTASGDIEIVEGLATANGNLELNWEEGFFEAAGNFNLLQGLIQAENASFRADTSLNVNMQAAATFSVPDPIPLIGGTQGLSGNVFFEYINDGTFANDSAAAWSVFNLPVIGPRTLGFRVWFDGSFSLLGASEVEALPNQAEGETQSAASYEIAADSPWAIFSASWEIPNAAEFTITMPDGTVLSEADVVARDDMALVTEFQTTTRRVLVVNQPAAGEWIVNIAGGSDLGSIDFFTAVPSAIPQLSIHSVTGGTLRSDVEISYSAGDDDSAAAVTFFYDVDASGNDGVRIGSLIESDASGEFNWSTAAVVPGTYFVYAVIDDGINAPQVIYAAETITVTTSGVEGLLWYDLNANGQREDGELAAGGTPVFVDLNLDGDWNANEPLASADDAGVYRIYDLAAGDYQLRVLPKPGFVASEPVEGVFRLTLSPGEFVSGRDFGLRQSPASISGVVWRDQDRDGFRDVSEARLPNVSVSLTNLWGEAVAATTTNNEGQYAFTSIVPGEYRVHFTPPLGHMATSRLVAGKDDFDSDITPGAASALLSPGANEHLTGVDAGFFHPFQSPRHPLDVDGDGFIVPLDALLVIIHLNAAGSGTPTSAPPYLDVDANNVIAPLDALLIINYLNAGGASTGDSGEGEAPAMADARPAPAFSGVDWYFYHYGLDAGRSDQDRSLAVTTPS